MMNNYQQAVFEQMSAGMSPADKEALRVELEKRVEAAAQDSATVAKMQYWAQRTQQELNSKQERQHAVIVAVDLHGGFSKEGKIPWHYSADFEWFKSITENHICVMGRTTYDDINTKMGERGESAVLPNRMSFVVTSSPLPRNNATAIKSLSSLDAQLYDVDQAKTVFYIGGERVYQEGIAKANIAYVTVVNKIVDADKFFPTKYLQTHFSPVRNQQSAGSPDLRFTTWARR